MSHFNQEGLELDFPCDFPIKVVGLASEDFERRICEIAAKHDTDFTGAAVKRNQSSGGKYQSLTLGIRATSKAQLSTIYDDLKACELVLWAL